MALFGGIGKALGLGTPAGRGFVTGLATKLSEEIDADVEATQDRMSRLADLRLERVSRNAERYQTENRENTDIITNMAKKLEGDTEAVQFLIDEYGFVGAQAEVEKLSKLREIDGEILSPTRLLNIQRTSGNRSTISNIANRVTRPIQDLDLSKTDPRVGFQRLFGTEEASIAELTRRSNQDIEAAGYGDMMKTSTAEDMGVLQGRRVYPWLNTLTGNPQTDHMNMRVLANKLSDRYEQASGTKKEALFQEFETAKLLADDAKLKIELVASVGGPLSQAESKDFGRQMQKVMANAIGATSADDYSNGVWVGAARSGAQLDALAEAEAITVTVANEAAKAGVDAATRQAALTLIAKSNRVPMFKDGEIVPTDTPLIDVYALDDKDEPIFPMFKHKPPTGTDTGRAMAISAGNKTAKDLVDEGRAATTEAEKQSIRAELLSMKKDDDTPLYTVDQIKNMF